MVEAPITVTDAKRQRCMAGVLCSSALAALLATGLLLAAQQSKNEPISIHPRNPHYFLFRGHPAVLIGSSEHYASVTNPDFDYLRYLDALKANNLNATRLFSGTYRELEESFRHGQAGNALAPKADRFLAPWPRTEQPGAVDGQNKFDVSRWNEAYFKRLRGLVEAASQRGIIVEMVLFSNYYDDAHWATSPLNAQNNINGAGKVPLVDSSSLKNPQLLAAEDALVRKMAIELDRFDNVYYEVCNEPPAGAASLRWQEHIAAVLFGAEASRPHHLIAQEAGYAAKAIAQPIPGASMLTFHTPRAPQVMLNRSLNIPLGMNETGYDGVGPAPYRVEAWQFLLAGGAETLELDYSFTVGHEDGSFALPAGQLGGGGAALRRELGILHVFMDQMDFVDMAPAPSVITGGVPANASAYVLAQAGKSYAIYVHHGRSHVSNEQLLALEKGDTRGLDLSGRRPWYVVDRSPQTLRLQLELPPGSYVAEWINTKTGNLAKKEVIRAVGETTVLTSPTYSEDIALRIVFSERNYMAASSSP